MSNVEASRGKLVCHVCLLAVEKLGPGVEEKESDGRKKRLKTSSDEGNCPLTCAECNAAAGKRCEMIRKIKLYENFYFAPRRRGKLGFKIKFEFGFNVCRVCLTPSTVEELRNAYNDSAKLAQLIMYTADIDVFKDNEKHECLVCEACSLDLEAAFEFKYGKVLSQRSDAVDKDDEDSGHSNESFEKEKLLEKEESSVQASKGTQNRGNQSLMNFMQTRAKRREGYLVVRQCEIILERCTNEEFSFTNRLQPAERIYTKK